MDEIVETFTTVLLDSAEAFRDSEDGSSLKEGIWTALVDYAKNGDPPQVSTDVNVIT